MRRPLTALLCVALAAGCAASEAVRTDDAALSVLPARDWTHFPAIVTVPTAPATIYAVSDIHGGFDRAANLLAKNGLLAGTPSPPSAAQWTGGGSVLVVVGDSIDKGPQSVEVIELLMALEADAATKGGRVIVALGNHEAEFFADPNNSKASGAGGIDGELEAAGVRPADLASGADARGAWLRNRPFGVVVGDWFFAHAGDTAGLTTSGLETLLEGAVNAHADFDDPSIVGASSILESRDWFTQASTIRRNVGALGVSHIAFGHDPKALGPRGAIAVDPTHQLVRIDCGLSPLVNDSTGKLLRIQRAGTHETVDELDASGSVRPLF